MTGDKQLGDGDRMNSENISSSPKALSANEEPEDTGVSDRHSKLRDASFTRGLLCMPLKRQGLVVGEYSVSSCQGELHSVPVSKLKTKDGHTVGLVV